MKKISRRELIKMSGVPVSAAALGLAPFSTLVSDHVNPERKLKVVAVGAHPDDPETGCGGTMLILSGQGHEVVSAYLTRGEASIKQKHLSNITNQS